MNETCPKGNKPCWMRLRAERLFVQGFRRILSGDGSGDHRRWDAALNLYACELGPTCGHHALSAMWTFTQTYREKAICPMGHHGETCPFLCKDECLALSLVAAMQEQDRLCAQKCVLNLFKSNHRQEAETTAFRVTTDFVSVGLRFMPVPETVVDEILTRSALAEGAAGQATFH